MNWILTVVFGEKCPRCGRRLHKGGREWWFHQRVHHELDANHALQRYIQEMLHRP